MIKYTFEKFILTPNNLEKIVELETRFYKEDFNIDRNPIVLKKDLEDGFKNRYYDCSIAKKNDNIIGYLSWICKKRKFRYHKTFKQIKIATITDIYILHQHRDNFVGPTLMGFSLDNLSKNDYKLCFISIGEDDKNMPKILKYYKFQQINEKNGYIRFKKGL